MLEEKNKPDDTITEEIFFVDGKWKISKETAETINDLLKPCINQGDISYHVEWSPGKLLSLSVKFCSRENDTYKTKGSKPLKVVQDLLTEINS